MPRHYIDQESDRDALFASRNLVSLEFAADVLKVSPHTLEKSASRSQGPLLMWIFGGGRPGHAQVPRGVHRYGTGAWARSPHAWQGCTPEELLGEARQHLADPNNRYVHE